MQHHNFQVSIKHLSDWEVDWDDTKPLRSRKGLQLKDLLPSEADGEEQLLVTEFDSLSDLKRHVHPEEPLLTANVVLMRLLFQNEKYTSENVEILRETAKDSNLHGNPQVINTHTQVP